MSKTIRIGGMDVVIPDESSLDSEASQSLGQFRNEKPEEPEKLDNPPYVYRPNDPFQSSVDRVVALGNVNETKPWVKKAFMILFLIVPLTIAGITAINALLFAPSGEKLRQFLEYTVIGLVACAPALLIWFAKLRKKH